MTYAKDWYHKNKEKHLQNCKKYYLEDKENHKIRSMNWQKENPERMKILRKRNHIKHKKTDNERCRKYTLKRKLLVLNYYSNNQPKCGQCAVDNIFCLDLDHTNNNGASERKETKTSGAGFYGWIIKNKYPEGYQVLCRNCNYLKYVDLKNNQKIQ